MGWWICTGIISRRGICILDLDLDLDLDFGYYVFVRYPFVFFCLMHGSPAYYILINPSIERTSIS